MEYHIYAGGLSLDAASCADRRRCPVPEAASTPRARRLVPAGPVVYNLVYLPVRAPISRACRSRRPWHVKSREPYLMPSSCRLPSWHALCCTWFAPGLRCRPCPDRLCVCLATTLPTPAARLTRVMLRTHWHTRGLSTLVVLSTRSPCVDLKRTAHEKWQKG